MNVNTNYSSYSNVNMKGNLSTIAESTIISEQMFDKLIETMPKKKNGTIDARYFDKKDKEIFKEIKATLETCNEKFAVEIGDFKRYFMNKITNEKLEVYNGRKAQVTRNLFGYICSIKTDASTEKEAVKSLSMKRCGIIVINRYGCQRFVYKNYKNLVGVPLYKAKYTTTTKDGKKVVNEDYFIWNDSAKTMDHILGKLRFLK